MTVYTTLNKIRAFEPCKKGWETLLSSLGKTVPDDEPLSLVSILESNGLADALWCTCTVLDEHREKIVTFAIRCAENVLPIFEKEFPNEKRPRLAIQAAKDYLAGKITGDKLESAADSASYAAGLASSKNVADVASAAALAAAWAAVDAAVYAVRAAAADAAAVYAAGDAWAAVDAAVYAAGAAGAAAADAAADAAWAATAARAAEEKFQENLFREIFG